jgi:hypothetical protein
MRSECRALRSPLLGHADVFVGMPDAIGATRYKRRRMLHEERALPCELVGHRSAWRARRSARVRMRCPRLAMLHAFLATRRPFHGTLRAFLATRRPFLATRRPFHGTLRAFPAMLCPFLATRRPFHGTLRAFPAMLHAFVAMLYPFFGVLRALLGERRV